MKKIFLLLILALLLCTCIVLPVSAAGNGRLSLTGGSAKTGETVNVTVSLPSNPGLITLKIAITYAADLELTSVSNSGLLPGWVDPAPNIASPYMLFWKDALSTENHNQTGTLATLTFKVKSGATPGNKTITVSCSESRDKDGQKNTISSGSSTISVPCTNHQWSDWSQTKEPKCGVKGEESRTCSACGTKETREVAALEHKWSDWAKSKDPGCETKGEESHSCSVCQKVETREIAATGHKWGGYVVSKKPSCTEKGTETRTCSSCQKTETRDVAATGHSFGAWTQTKKPGCEEKGQETRSCANCDHKETRDVAALGHHFTNKTVTKEPTCTAAGEETGTCSRCGKTTTQAVKALGHTWGAWKDGKKADCEHAGEQTRTCTRCNEEQKRTVAALGHDFEDPQLVKEATLTETGLMQGKCKRCGKTTDQVIPCSAADPATGIEVQAEEGAFEKGTELKVEKIDPASANSESVKNALADVSSKYVGYDLSADLNGAAVQPKQTVTVTLPVPEGYSDKIALYAIGEDGVATEIESALSEDGKSLTASVETLGRVALVDLSAESGTDVPKTEPEQPDVPATSEKPASPAEEDGDFPTAIAIIAAVAVLAVIAGVVLFLKKRKDR